MKNLKNVIVKPILTEKATLEMEKNNKYVFQVALNSNKNQIKESIESHFNVKVERISTNITSGGTKKTMRGTKQLPKFKKAYVQIKAGQKIEFFKNI